MADHLAECIDIVRISGHDISVIVRVKVADRKFFHMGEHVITQIL